MKQYNRHIIIFCVFALSCIVPLIHAFEDSALLVEGPNQKMPHVSDQDCATLIENRHLDFVYIPRAVKKIIRKLHATYPDLAENEQAFSLCIATQTNIAPREAVIQEIQHVCKSLFLLPYDQRVFQEHALYIIKNYRKALVAGDAAIFIEHEQDNHLRIVCTCLMHDLVHGHERSLDQETINLRQVNH